MPEPGASMTTLRKPKVSAGIIDIRGEGDRVERGRPDGRFQGSECGWNLRGDPQLHLA